MCFDKVHSFKVFFPMFNVEEVLKLVNNNRTTQIKQFIGSNIEKRNRFLY
jgi:hypothetical protein